MPSKKVYVANIPYDLKEEQLRRILERAGPIVTFDLLKKDSTRLDREHSGVAWCTYGTDADAANAIRLLNGFHVNNRALRVAPSDKRGARRAMLNSGKNVASGNKNESREPAFEIVKKLTPQQRWDILFQFQDLMARRPRMAREILVDEPQIAQSLALINQFVRGGRQQHITAPGSRPVPVPVPVAMPRPPALMRVPFPPPPPGSSSSRAPQFLLNTSNAPPAMRNTAPIVDPRALGANRAWGGAQPSSSMKFPTDRRQDNRYSDGAIVQTISRGPALAAGKNRQLPPSGRSSAPAGRSRGSSNAPTQPVKRARRSRSDNKKIVDDLL